MKRLGLRDLAIRTSISIATAWAGIPVMLFLVSDFLWSEQPAWLSWILPSLSRDERVLIVGIVVWAVLAVASSLLLLLLDRPATYFLHAGFGAACTSMAVFQAWRKGWGEPTIMAAHVSIASAWILAWSIVYLRNGRRFERAG